MLDVLLQDEAADLEHKDFNVVLLYVVLKDIRHLLGLLQCVRKANLSKADVISADECQS